MHTDESQLRKQLYRPGLPSDFMCHNDVAEDVINRVEEAGLKVETMIENVGSLIKEGKEEHRRVKRQTDNMNWENYQRLPTL